MVFLPTDTITGAKNTTNGGISSYEVAITTKVALIDGDILSFTVPSQLVVPSDATDLHITSISRVVGSDTDVTDVLSVNVAGNTIVVTFVTAGAANNVYRFSLDNIVNPPSSLPSDPFTNIFIQDVHRDNVMVFYNVGPTVATEQAALIQNAILVQGTETPATATTYTISFDPYNPIPTTGSIEITWPSEVEITRDNTDCTIQINRQWTGCDIDESEYTITFNDVFVDVNENGWRGRIVVTLTNVINPVNNTQLGTGFIINTYADGNQIHIIDHLPHIYLVPQSECAYPCQTCPTSDRENC